MHTVYEKLNFVVVNPPLHNHHGHILDIAKDKPPLMPRHCRGGEPLDAGVVDRLFNLDFLRVIPQAGTEDQGGFRCKIRLGPDAVQAGFQFFI